jgi:phthalate 4,5-cis-dihydrodiol dehydrogenase
MAEPIRFGMVGLGNEGAGVVPFFNKVADVNLAAAADLRLDALDTFKEDHPEARTFTSLKEMCESGAVDAVWIATPSQFHAEHAITAAEAGVSVVLEKPMAVNIDDAHRVVEAFDKSGARFVLHSHASDPPIKKMREIIASGRLGRPIGIHTTMHKGWLRSPRLAAELDTSQGGGVVFRQGPHEIEIVRRLGGGMVKSLKAYTGRWAPGLDTEGNFTALLEFEQGHHATLVLYGYGFFNVSDLTWNIGEGGTASSGEYRALRSRPTGPADPATFYESERRPGRDRSMQAERQHRQPIYGLTIVTCENGEMRQSPDGVYVYDDNGLEEIVCDPYLDRAIEITEVRDALREDRPSFPDAHWARASLEVILGILESGRTHRDVEMKYQVPTPV